MDADKDEDINFPVLPPHLAYPPEARLRLGLPDHITATKQIIGLLDLPISYPFHRICTRSGKFALCWHEFSSTTALPSPPDPALARAGDVFIDREGRSVWVCYAAAGHEWRLWEGNSAVRAGNSLVHPLLSSDHKRRDRWSYVLWFNGDRFRWMQHLPMMSSARRYLLEGFPSMETCVEQWINVAVRRRVVERVQHEPHLPKRRAGNDDDKQSKKRLAMTLTARKPIVNPNSRNGLNASSHQQSLNTGSARGTGLSTITTNGPGAASTSTISIGKKPQEKPSGIDDRNPEQHGRVLLPHTKSCTRCMLDGLASTCSGLPGRACRRCNIRHFQCSRYRNARQKRRRVIDLSEDSISSVDYELSENPPTSSDDSVVEIARPVLNVGDAYSARHDRVPQETRRSRRIQQRKSRIVLAGPVTIALPQMATDSTSMLHLATDTHTTTDDEHEVELLVSDGIDAYGDRDNNHGDGGAGNDAEMAPQGYPSSAGAGLVRRPEELNRSGLSVLREQMQQMVRTVEELVEAVDKLTSGGGGRTGRV